MKNYLKNFLHRVIMELEKKPKKVQNNFNTKELFN